MVTTLEKLSHQRDAAWHVACTSRAPVELPGGGKDLYIRQDKFQAQFAADVPDQAAKQMAAGQRPIIERAASAK